MYRQRDLIWLGAWTPEPRRRLCGLVVHRRGAFAPGGAFAPDFACCRGIGCMLILNYEAFAPGCDLCLFGHGTKWSRLWAICSSSPLWDMYFEQQLGRILLFRILSVLLFWLKLGLSEGFVIWPNSALSDGREVRLWPNSALPEGRKMHIWA